MPEKANTGSMACVDLANTTLFFVGACGGTGDGGVVSTLRCMMTRLLRDGNPRAREGGEEGLRRQRQVDTWGTAVRMHGDGCSWPKIILWGSSKMT